MSNDNEAWIDGLPLPAQIAVTIASATLATCIAIAAYALVTA